MIEQNEGETELSVKIHYDNMVSDVCTSSFSKVFISKHFSGE